MGIAADTRVGAPGVAVPRRGRTRFYAGLSAFMIGIVVVGFWPSYFGPLLRGQVARPAVIQGHGLVFVGWMALLMAQVVFAARGKLQMHRRVGRYGIAYIVTTVGLFIGGTRILFEQSETWLRMGRPLLDALL